MKIASMGLATFLLLAPFGHAVQTSDAKPEVATEQQRLEMTDSRGTGHLVRVDASGKRFSNGFAIKAHWFPGVLRVLLQVMPSPSAGADSHQEERTSILFEMRPSGANTIRILRPHDAAPVSLSFDQWMEGVSGSDFAYEDFLQPELYWKDQAMLTSERLGSHDCDVLQSIPGPTARSHYAKVQTWFDHMTGYPLYVEKSLKAATTVKQFTSLGVTQSGGIWAARQVEVKVRGRLGSTLLIFDHGSTKAHLTAKDFSVEQMSRFEEHP